MDYLPGLCSMQPSLHVWHCRLKHFHLTCHKFPKPAQTQWPYERICAHANRQARALKGIHNRQTVV